MSLLLTVLPLILAAEPTAPNGMRIQLTDGRLFVPEGFEISDGGIDLTLQLHGSDSVAETNFIRAKRRGVLVTVMLKGLSSVYTERFKDPKVFARLLDEAQAELVKLGLPKKPWRHVTVSSFSAGYGGVREVLKDEKAFARIDAIVLADSLYAGYVVSGAERRVDPGQMAGFLRYAKKATAGEKWMIISHCQLQPDGYASTGETADYLLAEMSLKREMVSEKWPGGLELLSRCRAKHFEVYAFEGKTGADHVRHVQNLAAFWERLPR
jgi:hypothetical protein